MTNKYKIIAICGKAGAGKDTLLRAIADKFQVHEIVSCTTRPKREGEVEGVNYYFISSDEFLKKVLNDDMLEATSFNGWFYGTMKQGLDENGWNIGVFNPEGIEYLCANPDVEVEVFYLSVSNKTRMLRQLNREDNPDVYEIVRRFSADEEDFKNLPFKHNVLFNEEESEISLAMHAVASFAGLQVKSN